MYFIVEKTVPRGESVRDSIITLIQDTPPPPHNAIGAQCFNKIWSMARGRIGDEVWAFGSSEIPRGVQGTPPDQCRFALTEVLLAP